MTVAMSETVIGVVGAGAMGSGIAQIAALKGNEVILSDSAPDAVGRALSSIEKSFARDVEKGRLEAAAAESARARLTPASSETSFASCQVIIEAVVERLDVKQSLFRGLEGVVSD